MTAAASVSSGRRSRSTTFLFERFDLKAAEDLSADPKPRKRVTDTKAGRMKILQERVCRVCSSDDYAVGRHHLVSRAQGGDDHEDNLVPLCAVCHDTLHHSKQGREWRGQLGYAHCPGAQYISERRGELGSPTRMEGGKE